MKREIITIDESLCNGCGECITACAEGALKLVDGKAKLVKQQFCDGFGDCMGECPTGALKIVEQDVPDYDPAAAREHVAKTLGVEAVRGFDAAAKAHGVAAVGDPGRPRPSVAATSPVHGGGCPGTMMRFDARRAARPSPTPLFGGRGADISAADISSPDAGGMGVGVQVQQAIRSELNQWPIQIHLVRPDAPFFKDRELVVLSSCSPIASADIHWRFIRGRSVVVGCPKLDRTDGYVEKLAAILQEPSIPKVTIVRMEVPCCGGLTAIVREAARQSGRTDLDVEEVMVGLTGDIR